MGRRQGLFCILLKLHIIFLISLSLVAFAQEAACPKTLFHVAWATVSLTVYLTMNFSHALQAGGRGVRRTSHEQRSGVTRRIADAAPSLGRARQPACSQWWRRCAGITPCFFVKRRFLPLVKARWDPRTYRPPFPPPSPARRAPDARSAWWCADRHGPASSGPHRGNDRR